MIQKKSSLSEAMLVGYSRGIFPMANNQKDNSVFWLRPEKRGIIPIGHLHISRSLKKFIRKSNLVITVNNSFETVLKNCCNRTETWINWPLKESYIELYNLKYAYSIEVWSHKQLIGGLFGVVLGTAFFAESMFSTETNGSKISMVALMGMLVYCRFTLLDVQFLSKHLVTMGAKEIHREHYENQLSHSILEEPSRFETLPCTDINYLIQLNNSTSYL